MTLLDDLVRIRNVIDGIGPPPAQEMRIHPDDLAELMKHAGKLGRVGDAFYPTSPLFGIRLTPDPEAPRLPRVPR